MAKRENQLTVLYLKSLKLEAKGTTVKDGGGLSGVVSIGRDDRVSISFTYQFRVGDKRREKRCGSWPASDLATIRAERDRLRAIVAEGVDPIEQANFEREQAERQKREEAARLREADAEAAKLANRHTISSLFEAWHSAAATKRKDAGKEVRRAFEKDVLPSIGNMALEDVRRRHVMALLDDITARGVGRMANRVLSDLRQMFRYALIREYVEIDPTALISKEHAGGKEQERGRVLSPNEIRKLAAAVPFSGLVNVAGSARLELPTQCAIWLMLSTLARVGEVVRARWQDVDFEKKEWRIPAEHSKNGEPHVIHLSDFALQQFKRLRGPREFAKARVAYAIDDTWVFPATRREGYVCIKTVQKQIKDRQRTTALPKRTKTSDALRLADGDWTAHDLRRTGATMLGNLGVRGDVIEKCLNHAEDNKVKRIYQRADLMEERREAFILLGKHLSQLTSSI
ncbi:tyrosine-type recombinase/integrase [Chitinimonas sp. PSY-7]|uniref:tyrosine-type recombinase/integrase n=1 Tax=Chitinimonas sp. PSY-7 TaxID=3459088 RepID=UPI00403FD169